jgi:Metal-dependent hydrolases of the beta-lactamase superfamily III
MERLIVLGTGNAMATRCYNTCFALHDQDEYFLVDGGGGNGILVQMDRAGIPFGKVRHAFLTHSHTDHIFGMIWVLRKVATLAIRNEYNGVFTMYCHRLLLDTLRTIVELTLTPAMTNVFDKKIEFCSLRDGETKHILGRDVTFFDIRSTKEKQFAFSTSLHNGKKLTFLGDEPYNEYCESCVQGSDWLLSEAFCLYSQRDIFKPYEKHHSTVREACELAERMGVENLVLWHTEDTNMDRRRSLYTAESRAYFSGKVYVPDDLDVIDL